MTSVISILGKLISGGTYLAQVELKDGQILVPEVETNTGKIDITLTVERGRIVEIYLEKSKGVLL